jgi:UPF0755 protein
VRQRDRELITDSDPHGLLFGSADDQYGGSADDQYGGSADERYGDADSNLLFPDAPPAHRPSPTGRSEPRISRREERAETSLRSRRRRTRRLMVILAFLLVIVVGVAGWLIALPLYRYFNPADYAGSGTGTVVVTVQADDGAKQIGGTLHDKQVVASVRAFTDAASKNSKSKSITPGSYKLHRHMSGGNAVRLLLDPAARIDSDVVVTEGATSLDVERRLVAAPCSASSSASTICGLGLDRTDVVKALENVAALGLPTDYRVAGKLPLTAEGFLFPATYPFDDSTSASEALQQMVAKFTDQVRVTDFTQQAKALKITPYQELIIASIAQAEAKFSADMPKVARVILNRIAASRNLQIDATSAYAAKLKGLDPANVIYADIAGPYNTYNHLGLPPTPIDNPGAEAMQGAAHPAAGNWMYYVNGDQAGNLFFTNSEAAFEKAKKKCHDAGWGCGA